MPKRSLRRLAGLLAIELLLGFLAAADSGYQAGAADFGQARALVLVDRHHHPAVILNVAFPAPLEVSDRIAAMAAKAHGLDRSALLIYSIGDGQPAPQDAVTAISAALSGLQPAHATYGNGILSISTPAGCHSVFSDSVIRSCTQAAGELVRGSVRSAFRVVDLTRGLQVRSTTPRFATVQAIAVGETVVIVSAPANFAVPAPGQIVASLPAIDPDARVAAALANVLARVGHKP